VPLGNGVFAIVGIAVFAYLREIAIEMLLQFVVENNAKVSASVSFDLYSPLSDTTCRGRHRDGLGVAW
jgi:hypothetical protein